VSALFPLYGLAYVQPVTEFIAMTVALLMYVRFSKKSAARTLNER